MAPCELLTFTYTCPGCHRRNRLAARIQTATPGQPARIASLIDQAGQPFDACPCGRPWPSITPDALKDALGAG